MFNRRPLTAHFITPAPRAQKKAMPKILQTKYKKNHTNHGKLT